MNILIYAILLFINRSFCLTKTQALNHLSARERLMFNFDVRGMVVSLSSIFKGIKKFQKLAIPSSYKLKPVSSKLMIWGVTFHNQTSQMQSYFLHPLLCASPTAFECLSYLQPYLTEAVNSVILSLTSSRKIRKF